MSARSLIMSAAGNAGDKLYVDDVFSTYTYTGNGSTQTITNGIDLAGKGGMVWVKRRGSGEYPKLLDSARTNSYMLSSAATSAEQNLGVVNLLSNGFNFPGFTGDCNTSSGSYVSWTFRKAPKFFLNTTVTKSSGSNATIDLSSLGTVGMVMVKRTDAVGSWYVFHRSATAGKLLYLEQTASEATLGHITVSGTTLTLVNGVIADGSYVVYAWAHDSSADGIVQCGSFTSDIGGLNINLGWELQYLLVKCTSGDVPGWNILDVSRGMAMSGGAILQANNASAEGETSLFTPTATGLYLKPGQVSTGIPFVYLAIRRSNKPPTTGTQVYNAIARTGTGAAATVTGVGFAPDLVMSKVRNGGGHGAAFDRLRGALPRLYPSAAASESSAYSDQVTSFGQDGMSVGPDASTLSVNAITPYIYHFFKRAPGVFDVVCHVGTGSTTTVAHGLSAIPELIIRKSRTSATGWPVWCSAAANTGNGEAFLNLTDPYYAGDGNFSAVPTATSFSGSFASGNYVSYLFATKIGISKVGNYTGNGTSQTINCGFTTGSRFILIKRTDSTGDWFVYDTARGIVAGNDPHLSLNTTAAEVATDDSIDPDASGFVVNQLAATNLNVTAATYIYLSFA